MEQTILFSIIVPTYNRSALIGKTLKSLQAQEFRDYEILIVDDGSTDNTEEIVKPFLNGYTSYYKKNNAERAAARNFGGKLARGKYVNFFDSDDLALPNHLTTAKQLVEEKSGPEWFHLGYEWAYPDGQVFKKVNDFTAVTLNERMGAGNVLSCNGVFVRKDIFENNLFNEQRALSASEDFELWMRLSARYPLYYSNIITSVIVDHEARSVHTPNAKKLVERIDILLSLLQADEMVQKVYGRNMGVIRMEVYSYIALHIAEQPSQKLNAIGYIFKSIGNSATYLGNRRFYATIKKILLKW